jgi:release factor glutamine methyltransferase
LVEASDILRAAGIDEASREVDEMYAALVLGATSRAFLDQHEPITELMQRRLLDAARRRASGMPQAYAVGRANFRGHWLAVDERVLIPRPETEGLVDIVIEWARIADVGLRISPAHPAIRDPQSAPRLPVVADIGTGSGAIAIALALEAPIAGVIATDVSADALNVALENAASTGTRERIAFRRGPLLAPLLGDVVDAIVSNPPYVSTRECDELAPAVKDYEPRLALDGGADGLAVIRRLVAEAPAALVPGGLLALEVDARRAEQTAALVGDGGFAGVTVKDDLFGRPRYVIARRTERE